MVQIFQKQPSGSLRGPIDWYMFLGWEGEPVTSNPIYQAVTFVDPGAPYVEKVPPAPTLSVAMTSRTTVDVSWIAAPGFTGPAVALWEVDLQTATDGVTYGAWSPILGSPFDADVFSAGLTGMPTGSSVANNIPWNSGVYGGTGTINAFESYRGKSVWFQQTYSIIDWAAIESPSLPASPYNTNFRSVLVVYPFPKNDSSYNWADMAAGNYNSHYTTQGQNLITAGRTDVILCLAHEYNQDSSNVTVNAQGARNGQVEQTANMRAGWRHWVNSLRAASVGGVHGNFEFMLNPGCGWNGSDPIPTLPYPGDSYVDHLWLDQYDRWYNHSTATTDERWAQILSGGPGYGIEDMQAFCRAGASRNTDTSTGNTPAQTTATKELGFGYREWGMWDNLSALQGGGGDNSAYFQHVIDNLKEFIAAGGQVSGEILFNTDSTIDNVFHQITPTGGFPYPLAKAKYASLYASQAGLSVTAKVGTGLTDNVESYPSSSFAVAVGDVIIVFAEITGTVATGTCVASNGMTFDLITTANSFSGVNTHYAFVSQNKVTTAGTITVTITCTGDAGTGAIIQPVAVQGMARSGLGAIRQVAIQSNRATGTTPSPAFGATTLSTNPILGFVGSGTNPPALFPPIGFTEATEFGALTPTTGGELIYAANGIAGTTISWQSTSPSGYGVIIVEMDGSGTTTEAAFRFRARGINSDGPGAYATFNTQWNGSVVNPPNRPTNLVATVQTGTSALLSWTASAGASLDGASKQGIWSGNTDSSIDIDPNAVSYMWSGLSQGTTYNNVNVRRFNAAGWSGGTNWIDFTTSRSRVTTDDPVMGQSIPDGTTPYRTQIPSVRVYSPGTNSSNIIGAYNTYNPRVIAYTDNWSSGAPGSEAFAYVDHVKTMLDDFNAVSGRRSCEIHVAYGNEIDRDWPSGSLSSAFINVYAGLRDLIWGTTGGVRDYPNASVWVDMTANNIKTAGAGPRFKPIAQYLDGMAASCYPAGRTVSATNNIEYDPAGYPTGSLWAGNSRNAYGFYLDPIFAALADWRNTGGPGGSNIESQLNQFACWEFGIPIHHSLDGDVGPWVRGGTVGIATDLTQKPRYLVGGARVTGPAEQQYNFGGFLPYVLAKCDAEDVSMREMVYWNQQSNIHIPNLWATDAGRTSPDSVTAWYQWHPGYRLPDF